MGKKDTNKTASDLVDSMLGEGFPAPTRNTVSDVPLADPRKTLATIKKALTELTSQVESLSSVIETMEFKKKVSEGVINWAQCKDLKSQIRIKNSGLKKHQKNIDKAKDSGDIKKLAKAITGKKNHEHMIKQMIVRYKSKC